MSLGLFQAITGLLPNPVVLSDAEGTILAANPAAHRFDERLRAGSSLFDLDLRDAEQVRAQLANWMRSGSALPGALIIAPPGEKTTRFRCHGARASWWDGSAPAVQLHIAPLDHADQFVALSQQVRSLNREVAFRRTAEAERARLLVAEQQTRTRLQHLYRLTAALASAATLTQVAAAVHQTAPAALDAVSVDLDLHSQRLVPVLGNAAGLRAPVGLGWRDLDHTGDLGDTAVPEELAAEPPTRIGLTDNGVVLGALTVHPRAGATTDPEHRTAIVQQIAQAVRRAGLYEHEHRVAERLQLSLLPRVPIIPGVQVATRYAPGTDMVEIGGDWYDLYDLDADHVGLSIGDVAGHGLVEATVMSQISAALRMIVRSHGTRPAAVLSDLDDMMLRYHRGTMATVCYLVFHRPSRTLRYAKAGHLSPLVVGADGVGRYLDQALTPPVGLLENLVRREAGTTLAEDDTLLLYTDGLVERRAESIDDGLGRLHEIACGAAGLGLQDLCDLLLRQLPDTASPDDRAILTVRFSGGSAAPAAPSRLCLAKGETARRTV